MKPSTRALIASLLFAIAGLVLSLQDKDAQAIVVALTSVILISTSWVCEAIEKGANS